MVRIVILGKARYHCLRLYIDIPTIFRAFLSWKTLFETVLRSFETFRRFRTILRGSALAIVEFVHWFIARSLIGSR